MWIFPVLFFVIYAVLLLCSSLSPTLDIAAASPFFQSGVGFIWRDMMVPNLLHDAIQWGARGLAAVLVITAFASAKHRKAAIFILAALLIGPGLLTNTVLKDNWGRARPMQIQEFGGSATYTPPLAISDQCDTNCSFVSGDGALGLFLHVFFYIVPARWRRTAFWAGFAGGGIVFGGLRIAMGAHFFSDVLWAGVLVLLSTAIIHAAFYGKQATAAVWRGLLANKQEV